MVNAFWLKNNFQQKYTDKYKGSEAIGTKKENPEILNCIISLAMYLCTPKSGCSSAR
jgi:hypothetical protein